MFRKYRIACKTRFTIFTAIVILLIFTCIGTLFGANDVSGSSTGAYNTVTITSGDTLWSIADEYSDEDTDIRRLVYEISELNEVNAGELTEGMQLIIPA